MIMEKDGTECRNSKTNYQTNHRREGLVFTMAEVNTEIIVPCYILTTCEKGGGRKDFSVAEKSVDNNYLCNQYHRIIFNLQENYINNATGQNNVSQNLCINCIMQHCMHCCHTHTCIQSPWKNSKLLSQKGDLITCKDTYSLLFREHSCN